jgi:hypothetical protein
MEQLRAEMRHTFQQLQEQLLIDRPRGQSPEVEQHRSSSREDPPEQHDVHEKIYSSIYLRHLSYQRHLGTRFTVSPKK